jgi:hypothetical protein
VLGEVWVVTGKEAERHPPIAPVGVKDIGIRAQKVGVDVMD